MNRLARANEPDDCTSRMDPAGRFTTPIACARQSVFHFAVRLGCHSQTLPNPVLPDRSTIPDDACHCTRKRSGSQVQICIIVQICVGKIMKSYVHFP